MVQLCDRLPCKNIAFPVLKVKVTVRAHEYSQNMAVSHSAASSLPLTGAATSISFVASFAATKLCLLQQNVCLL